MSNAHGLTNESQVGTYETEIKTTVVFFFLKRSVVFNSQDLTSATTETALIGLGGIRIVRSVENVPGGV